MKQQLTVREICVISIFTALTAIMAQIAIPLPFTPIPISFGMVGIYIAGMLLKPKHAVLSQVCYLMLGAVGMPVFGRFRGGLSALLGPTGGCLMVYPIMAAIISYTLNSRGSLEAEKRQGKMVLYAKTSAAISMALCVVYLCGAAWLAATTGNSYYGALTLVCFPFIPLDIAKIVFTVVVMLPFRSRMMSMNMLLLDNNRTGAAQTHSHNAAPTESAAVLEKALNGQDLTPADAAILMNPALTPIDALMQAANTITRRHFGSEVGMCAIYPAKVGLCSGDCAFCAQSVHHTCEVSPVHVSDLDEDEIIENARQLWQSGIERYSLVTSSERLTDAEFDRIVRLYERLSEETEIGLCASLGSLTPERASRLKEAGVSRYHHNIETSRSFFSQICSTHSYDDKLATLTIAREAGMSLCCGGILAVGETPAQRVEMAFALKNLDVDCVPINILHPIPGTRLENQTPPSTEEILRAIALFRLILPTKALRFAGGREKALGADEYRGYQAGINAMIVGNYLTTSGKSYEQEISNLTALGFTVKPTATRVRS